MVRSPSVAHGSLLPADAALRVTYATQWDARSRLICCVWGLLRPAVRNIQQACHVHKSEPQPCSPAVGTMLAPAAVQLAVRKAACMSLWPTRSFLRQWCWVHCIQV